MAVTCARCGAVNPDGNTFCQTCGTPLGAAAPPPAPPPQYSAPAGPPVAYASPPPVPLAYQSPYYTPRATAPQPAIHRTPWVLIVSGVVILIVLMAGCGTALALFGKGNLTVTGGITPDVPSPSPAGSPSPVASPSAIATSASNNGVTIPVPPGWVIANKTSETIVLTNPSGDGSVTVASGPSNPKQTAQQNKDTVDKIFQGKYPDTKNCPNSKTTAGSIAGALGILWTLCFTLTSSSQSFPAAAPLFAGANSDGSVYYLVMLMTNQNNANAFVVEATPVMQAIQWKLK